MPTAGDNGNGAGGSGLAGPSRSSSGFFDDRAPKRPRYDGFSDGGVRELARLGVPAVVADKLCAYLASLQDRDEPVVRLMSPEELRAAFRGAGVALELGEGGAAQKPLDNEALVKAVDLLLRYSVRIGSPLFFSQLYARVDPAALAADLAIAVTNTNSFTYELAPVFTLVEAEVLRKIAHVIGGEYANSYDGLFCSGSSMSNLYALHLAHHWADPALETRGAAGGPRCVAFASDQCHDSLLKSAKLIGLGSDNMVFVQTNERGQMDLEALEAAVALAKQKGFTPFFVGSTAGTTLLGAFDPVARIGEICRRHGMWHHVDGWWGGGALLSTKHRHLMAGTECADSVSWNPQMIGAGLQCAAFLTRHAHLLAKVNGTKATDCFKPDRLYADLDRGDKSIQCGRTLDFFKLWMLWKAKGDDGVRRTVDHCFALARFMADRLRAEAKDTGAWELAYEPSCSNVCFWYIPERMRPFRYKTATQEQKDLLHKVVPLLKHEMQRRGDAMVGSQAVNGQPNFFRMVFAAADTVREEDIVQLIRRMALIGEEEVAKANIFDA